MRWRQNPLLREPAALPMIFAGQPVGEFHGGPISMVNIWSPRKRPCNALRAGFHWWPALTGSP